MSRLQCSKCAHFADEHKEGASGLLHCVHSDCGCSIAQYWIERSDYTKPTLQELRLGRIIGEAAAKWWKVEDWYKSWQELKKEKPYLDDPNMYELYNLIVSLLEEKRR